MTWLITGGAGFIGVNAVLKLAARGETVLIVDTLVRKGSANNLRLIQERFPTAKFCKIDVRDVDGLAEIFQKEKSIDVVLHLAGQVAVTTSVSNPRDDFEINALGSFNVCEAVRLHASEAILLNASTNKVYGRLDHHKIIEDTDRYKYESLRFGVPATEAVDFYSPYGCSKGAADQYVRDYSRIYGLRTLNFRQSCIFGPYQHGMEDQGWLAWFAICLLANKTINICGDGKQVRDILYVDDLIDCYLKAIHAIDQISGKSYNVGGGVENTISLLQGIQMLESIVGRKARLEFGPWRPGDQRVFIADVREATQDFHWQPTTTVRSGMEQMVAWCKDHLHEILPDGR
jgi:CDP-paratose 2-epimerase